MGGRRSVHNVGDAGDAALRVANGVFDDAGSEGGQNHQNACSFHDVGKAHFVDLGHRLDNADGDATDSDTSTDRDAVGAHVWVDLDGDGDFEITGVDRELLQVVESGDGDNRAGDGYRLQFGLGPDPAPPWIKVVFPDGSRIVRAVTAAELSSGTVVLRDPP